MKTLLLIGFLALLPLVTPQVGDCSQDQINAFVESLPNPTECGLGLLTSFFPGTASDAQFQQAVENMCHVDCGRAVADFYVQQCNDVNAALYLIGSCLHNGRAPGEDRCRYTGPDRIPGAMINNLANCLNFDEEANVCPQNCNTSLAAISSLTGCCYQTSYNQTIALYTYVALAALTEEQAYFFSNITNPALWSACDIDLQPFCSTDNLFPGTPELIVGNCTEEDFANLDVTEECYENFAEVFVAQVPDNIDEACTSACGGAIERFERTRCAAPLSGRILRELCRPTEAMLGDRCYFTIGEDLRDAQFFTDVGACLVFDTDDCPAGCANALTELSNRLGCCYQNFYNDTRVLDYLAVNGTITTDERFFFGAVAIPSLWERCDVPLVDRCTMSAFEGDGAVKFTASAILVFFSILFSLM